MERHTYEDKTWEDWLDIANAYEEAEASEGADAATRIAEGLLALDNRQADTAPHPRGHTDGVP